MKKTLTTEFWRTVLSDYKVTQMKYPDDRLRKYICYSSYTFRDKWIDYSSREEIVESFRKFLEFKGFHANWQDFPVPKHEGEGLMCSTLREQLHEAQIFPDISLGQIRDVARLEFLEYMSAKTMKKPAKKYYVVIQHTTVYGLYEKIGETPSTFLMKERKTAREVVPFRKDCTTLEEVNCKLD